MRDLIYFVLCASIIVGCNSCGSNNKGKKLTDINVSEESDNAPVNVLEQTKPTIMVIPGDKLLMANDAFSEYSQDGKTYYVRDYNKFLLYDKYSRAIIGAVQNKFIEMGYPLNDLEQSLKSLNNQKITDLADNLAKDAKTMLMSVCKPDIIVELVYACKTDPTTRDINNYIDYDITFFDSFSNKSIVTINESGYGKSSKQNDFVALFSDSFNNQFKNVERQLTTYFADMLSKGREITFRVTLNNSSATNLTDEYNSMGETYADWIREWIKVNAKKGAATLQRNTAKEMYYVNVRISNLAEDGTQFSAYDFANAFRKEFIKTFNIGCTNATQGLGDAHIIIK